MDGPAAGPLIPAVGNNAAPHPLSPHSMEALHATIGRQQVDLSFLQEQCRAYEKLAAGLRQQLQAQQPTDGQSCSSQQQQQQQQQGRRGKMGALKPCCEKAVELYREKYHWYKSVYLNLCSRVVRCEHCPHCTPWTSDDQEQPVAYVLGRTLADEPLPRPPSSTAPLFECAGLAAATMAPSPRTSGSRPPLLHGPGLAFVAALKPVAARSSVARGPGVAPDAHQLGTYTAPESARKTAGLRPVAGRGAVGAKEASLVLALRGRGAWDVRREADCSYMVTSPRAMVRIEEGRARAAQLAARTPGALTAGLPLDQAQPSAPEPAQSAQKAMGDLPHLGALRRQQLSALPSRIQLLPYSMAASTPAAPSPLAAAAPTGAKLATPATTAAPGAVAAGTLAPPSPPVAGAPSVSTAPPSVAAAAAVGSGVSAPLIPAAQTAVAPAASVISAPRSTASAHAAPAAAATVANATPHTPSAASSAPPAVPAPSSTAAAAAHAPTAATMSVVPAPRASSLPAVHSPTCRGSRRVAGEQQHSHHQHKVQQATAVHSNNNKLEFAVARGALVGPAHSTAPSEHLHRTSSSAPPQQSSQAQSELQSSCALPAQSMVPATLYDVQPWMVAPGIEYEVTWRAGWDQQTRAGDEGLEGGNEEVHQGRQEVQKQQQQQSVTIGQAHGAAAGHSDIAANQLVVARMGAAQHADASACSSPPLLGTPVVAASQPLTGGAPLPMPLSVIAPQALPLPRCQLSLAAAARGPVMPLETPEAPAPRLPRPLPYFPNQAPEAGAQPTHLHPAEKAPVLHRPHVPSHALQPQQQGSTPEYPASAHTHLPQNVAPEPCEPAHALNEAQQGEEEDVTQPSQQQQQDSQGERSVQQQEEAAAPYQGQVEQQGKIFGEQHVHVAQQQMAHQQEQLAAGKGSRLLGLSQIIFGPEQAWQKETAQQTDREQGRGLTGQHTEGATAAAAAAAAAAAGQHQTCTQQQAGHPLRFTRWRGVSHAKEPQEPKQLRLGGGCVEQQQKEGEQPEQLRRPRPNCEQVGSQQQLTHKIQQTGLQNEQVGYQQPAHEIQQHQLPHQSQHHPLPLSKVSKQRPHRQLLSKPGQQPQSQQLQQCQHPHHQQQKNKQKPEQCSLKQGWPRQKHPKGCFLQKQQQQQEQGDADVQDVAEQQMLCAAGLESQPLLPPVRGDDVQGLGSAADEAQQQEVLAQPHIARTLHICSNSDCLVIEQQQRLQQPGVEQGQEQQGKQQAGMQQQQQLHPGRGSSQSQVEVPEQLQETEELQQQVDLGEHQAGEEQFPPSQPLDSPQHKQQDKQHCTGQLQQAQHQHQELHSVNQGAGQQQQAQQQHQLTELSNHQQQPQDRHASQDQHAPAHTAPDGWGDLSGDESDITQPSPNAAKRLRKIEQRLSMRRVHLARDVGSGSDAEVEQGVSGTAGGGANGCARQRWVVGVQEGDEACENHGEPRFGDGPAQGGPVQHADARQLGNAAQGGSGSNMGSSGGRAIPTAKGGERMDRNTGAEEGGRGDCSRGCTRAAGRVKQGRGDGEPGEAGKKRHKLNSCGVSGADVVVQEEPAGGQLVAMEQPQQPCQADLTYQLLQCLLFPCSVRLQKHPLCYHLVTPHTQQQQQDTQPHQQQQQAHLQRSARCASHQPAGPAAFTPSTAAAPLPHAPVEVSAHAPGSIHSAQNALGPANAANALHPPTHIVACGPSAPALGGHAVAPNHATLTPGPAAAIAIRHTHGGGLGPSPRTGTPRKLPFSLDKAPASANPGTQQHGSKRGSQVMQDNSHSPGGIGATLMSAAVRLHGAEGDDEEQGGGGWRGRKKYGLADGRMRSTAADLDVWPEAEDAARPSATLANKSKEQSELGRQKYLAMKKRLGERQQQQQQPQEELKEGASEARAHKYNEVVRKKDDRVALPGYACHACREFFESLAPFGGPGGPGMPSCEHMDQAAHTGGKDGMASFHENIIQDNSRHRAQFAPPQTPPGYWALGFPDEAACELAAEAVAAAQAAALAAAEALIAAEAACAAAGGPPSRQPQQR